MAEEALPGVAKEFSISNRAQQKLDDWLAEHKKTCTYWQNNPANPGHSGYFTATSAIKYVFTPSGVGDFCKVICLCGETIDITDYESF